MKELPLVFFTVLAQAAAGAFLLAQICLLLNKLNRRQAGRVGVIALVLVMIAGVSALMHLGQPLRAVNALFGLGRSPMSNEIISCALFGGLLFVYVAGEMTGRLSAAAVNWAGYVAAVAGLVLLILIPAVYQLATIPAWSTSFTTTQMLLTALICGGAILTAVHADTKGWLVTGVATLVLFALSPGYFAFLSRANVDFSQQELLFWAAKYTLLTVGMLMLILAVFAAKADSRARIATLASVLVVIGELAGRIGFYDLWAIGM